MGETQISIKNASTTILFVERDIESPPSLHASSFLSEFISFLSPLVFSVGVEYRKKEIHVYGICNSCFLYYGSERNLIDHCAYMSDYVGALETGVVERSVGRSGLRSRLLSGSEIQRTKEYDEEFEGQLYSSTLSAHLIPKDPYPRTE